MNPEQKLSLLREILNLSESRAAKIRAADDAYSTGLRQSLDRLLMNGNGGAVIVNPESLVGAAGAILDPFMEGHSNSGGMASKGQ